MGILSQAVHAFDKGELRLYFGRVPPLDNECSIKKHFDVEFSLSNKRMENYAN